MEELANHMYYYKTPGIILKSESYRESDRIYSIYTEKYGKMKAMAKGVRKIKSKLAGHLEPFNLTNLMIVRGKAIDKIISAVTIDSFEDIKKDFEKIAQISYILEVVDVLTKEHHRDEKIFELLRKVLKELQLERFPIIHNSRFITVVRVRTRFIIHFLIFLGYKPELYQCVHCKRSTKYENLRKYEKGIIFSSKLGGLLCPQCKNFDQNGLSISEEGIGILRKMLLGEKVDTIKEVEKIIDSFLKYRLEKELNSEKFIEKISNVKIRQDKN